MSARSKARKRALDVLFEAEQRSAPVLDTLAGRVAAADPPVSEYAVELVEGVVSHQQRIDELLTTYSRDWALDRMPAVDRALLRLATYELLWCDDVPDAVVIDEAVTLARSLSTDESPAFVNGLLGRLLDLKPGLTAEPAAGADPSEEPPEAAAPEQVSDASAPDQALEAAPPEPARPAGSTGPR
jgi:N utilization substance protein B